MWTLERFFFCGSAKISAFFILSCSDIDDLSVTLLSQLLFGGQTTLATLTLTLRSSQLNYVDVK